MIRRRATPRLATCVIGLLGAFLATAVLGRTPLPANDGWVTDGAGFLTAPQEQILESLMESYKRGSGHEVALVTVPDLGGWSLEALALAIGRTWGIGTKDLNDGALLLVARKEHKVRIEVGRGLEGKLTDSISGRIIRGVIAPAFRKGRFYEGLRAGIEAIHAAAGGDYAQIPRQTGRRASRTLGLFPLLFLLFFVVSLLRRGGRGGGGGLLPWLLLAGMSSRGGSRRYGPGAGGFGGGGFGGFGGGGGFSGGGASGGW